MSERDREGTREPSAGEILTFSMDHRRRLHETPMTGCSECLLEQVMVASEDELVDLLEGAAEST